MQLSYVVLFTLLNCAAVNVAFGDPDFPGRNDGNCNRDVSFHYPPNFSFNRAQTCLKNAKEKQCDQLPAVCLNCTYSQECRYGSISGVSCRVNEDDGPIPCKGEKLFTTSIKCQYCYQTQEFSEHSCMAPCTQCLSVATPRQRFMSNCTVKSDVFCMGSRSFYKMKVCNFTTGYKWSTAFALSLTLGGFGVDRFYLGFWREGLGKLFSFGGLGVWTIIDVVLIGVGVITPADGSLYI